MLQACKASDPFKNTHIVVLNEILEKLLGVISISEVRRHRSGSFSPYFENIFSMIQEESEVEGEEAVPEEVKEQKEPVAEEMVQVDSDPSDDEDALFINEVISKEIIEGTVAICSGLKEEDERVRDVLTAYLRDGKPSIIYDLEGGDFSIQMRLLSQLRGRINKRSPNRFNFITLRLKEPGCTNIEWILDKSKSVSDLTCDELLESVGSDLELKSDSEPLSVDIVDSASAALSGAEQTVRADNLETTSIRNEEIDLDKIDKEILKLIPEWWPMKGKNPLAIPLLYWENVLYVALPKNREPNIIEAIQRRFPQANIKAYIQNENNWKLLSDYFSGEASLYKTNNTLIRPFMSFEEQQILLENAACIRNALILLLNKK